MWDSQARVSNEPRKTPRHHTFTQAKPQTVKIPTKPTMAAVNGANGSHANGAVAQAGAGKKGPKVGLPPSASQFKPTRNTGSLTCSVTLCLDVLNCHRLQLSELVLMALPAPSF